MLSEKEKPGILGEVCAARMLREKGYTIYTANYRCRFGEIDIIAANDKYITFTEVKTRSPGAISTAREAVDRRKQEKIIKTAQLYLQSNPVELQPRFDVVEVYIDKEQRVEKINHIENAFDGGK